MIKLVREEFVPLWVDIRKQSWPDIPAIKNADWELMVDDEREVNQPFFYWFYARTYVLTPDGEGLYNLQAGLTRRYQPEADLYKQMLLESLDKHRSGRFTRDAPAWTFWRL